MNIESSGEDTNECHLVGEENPVEEFLKCWRNKLSWGNKPYRPRRLHQGINLWLGLTCVERSEEIALWEFMVSFELLSQLLESFVNANPIFMHIFVTSNHVQMHMFIQYNHWTFFANKTEKIKIAFEFETDCIDLENFPINKQFYTKRRKSL